MQVNVSVTSPLKVCSNLFLINLLGWRENIQQRYLLTRLQYLEVVLMELKHMFSLCGSKGQLWCSVSCVYMYTVFCTYILYNHSSSDVLFRHWVEIMVFMSSVSFDHFCEWSPITSILQTTLHVLLWTLRQETLSVFYSEKKKKKVNPHDRKVCENYDGVFQQLRLIDLFLWFVFCVCSLSLLWVSKINIRLHCCSATPSICIYLTLNENFTVQQTNSKLRWRTNTISHVSWPFKKKKKKKSHIDRPTYTCMRPHTVCSPVSPHTHLFTWCLRVDFCQVSDFVVAGWIFWTLESVTGTFPSPGVGALIMGVPVGKNSSAMWGIFIWNRVTLIVI